MTTDKTRWADVPGFEGAYQVSDHGHVRSLTRPDHRGHVWQGRLMKPAIDGRGYPRIRLRKDNTTHAFQVHRLVAVCFVPNPGQLPEVNHKDTDKQNNYYRNLEWTTRSGNMLHAYLHGLNTPPLQGLGAGHHRFSGWVMAESTAAPGTGLVLAGKAQIIAAGFSYANVRQVIAGRCKTHKGFRFSRVSLPAECTTTNHN